MRKSSITSLILYRHPDTMSTQKSVSIFTGFGLSSVCNPWSLMAASGPLGQFCIWISKRKNKKNEWKMYLKKYCFYLREILGLKNEIIRADERFESSFCLIFCGNLYIFLLLRHTCNRCREKSCLVTWI